MVSRGDDEGDARSLGAGDPTNLLLLRAGLMPLLPFLEAVVPAPTVPPWLWRVRLALWTPADEPHNVGGECNVACCSRVGYKN